MGRSSLAVVLGGNLDSTHAVGSVATNANQVVFGLQLDILWDPSWGMFRVSSGVQAPLCLAYTAAFHGLAEPSFAASIVFQFAVFARCVSQVCWFVDPRVFRTNPKLGPGRWAALRWLPISLASAAGAVAVIVLELLYPTVAPSWVASTYSADGCTTPLISAGTSVLTAVSLIIYMSMFLG